MFEIDERSDRLIPFMTIFVLVWVSSTSPASAQSLSREAVANFSGADRQRILEDGAKQEGELNLYSSNVEGHPKVLESFREKYPYINVHIFRGDGPVIVQKIFEEHAASHDVADVIETATGGFQPLLQQEMLQSYTSPELAAYPKDAIEKGGHYAFNSENFVSLGFNTDLVSEAMAPKTLDELLDPKWYDKMAFPGTSTMTNWIGATLLEKGESFLHRLAQQRIRRYEISAVALSNMLVSGEVLMSPAIYSAQIVNSRNQGAHVAWRALGGVYANVAGVALPIGAPHPNAAMLYIDFVFSRAAQIEYQEAGYSSARTDLVNAAPPSKVYYLSEQPGYLNDYEKWTALGFRIFGKSEPQSQVK